LDPDPKKFGPGIDLNFSNFHKIKALSVVKIIFIVLKVSFQLSSNFKVNIYVLKDKTYVLSMKNLVLLNNIFIGILSAPDPDPNQLFGFGSEPCKNNTAQNITDPAVSPFTTLLFQSRGPE